MEEVKTFSLENVKDLYSSSSKIKELTESFAENCRIHLAGLSGSSDALVASACYNNLPGNYLFILYDKEEAAYFYNNLENITGKERGTSLLFYPGSYRRPYQIEETDNSNVIQRTEVLSIIKKRRKNTIVVTYPEAIVENVVSRKVLNKSTLELEVGVEYSVDFINELLIEHDFDKVDHVYEPGQFAVRGGIVDVYSFSNDMPYRIEFFGDEIESIRIFNPEDQLSITTMKKINIVPNVNASLLQEGRESFLNYIPADTRVWIKDFDLAKNRIIKGYEKAKYTFDKMEGTVRQLTPSELYLAPSDFELYLGKHPIVEFGMRFNFKPTAIIEFHTLPQPPFNKNFDLLIENLNSNSAQGITNIIASDNGVQLERSVQYF